MTKMSDVDAASATTPWMFALRITAEIFNRNGLDWMLIGSAATALRGASVEPGDLDIAVKSPGDVALTAELMPTAPEGEVPQEVDPTWIKRQAAPILHMNTQGERWTFARRIIGGFRVEVAHIDSPRATSLYLETRSPLSWKQREPLRCNGQMIPTVPIEAQLATMMARQQNERIAATLAAIDPQKLDRACLRQAIADKRTEAPNLVVPTDVQRVINT